jgi:hypothetical protein
LEIGGWSRFFLLPWLVEGPCSQKCFKFW